MTLRDDLARALYQTPGSGRLDGPPFTTGGTSPNHEWVYRHADAVLALLGLPADADTERVKAAWFWFGNADGYGALVAENERLRAALDPIMHVLAQGGNANEVYNAVVAVQHKQRAVAAASEEDTA